MKILQCDNCGKAIHEDPEQLLSHIGVEPFYFTIHTDKDLCPHCFKKKLLAAVSGLGGPYGK